MKLIVLLGLAGIFGALFFVGCAHDRMCNNVPQRPTPTPSSTPSEDGSNAPPPTPAPTQIDPADAFNEQKTLSDGGIDGPQVQVFKSSGEKQCAPNTAISIEAMGRVLTRQKIRVLESHSQPDGLMHMAVCGASTGKIHVFTIVKKQSKAAQKLGFKLLTLHE